MKLLLLLALVGLAASRYTPLRRGESQQFVYQYDTQIATGEEEVSNQFSTMRMRFRVLMQTNGVIDGETGAQRWMIQFQQVNLRQRINSTEQLPKTLLPMEMFGNLQDPELWRQIETALKKPFVCWIQPQLSVVKIQFHQQDPFWSVNTKKGFLQMFQLNFHPTDESVKAKETGQWTKEEDEMTVADVCRGFYSVERLRFHEASSTVYKVEKAIDFSNCRNPIDGSRNLPGMWSGLHHSDRIPMEINKKSLSVNNFGKFFVFAGSEGNMFMIKKGSMRTIYTLSPFSDSMHGTEKVIAIQSLKLLETVTESPISDSDLSDKYQNLRLIFPQEARLIERDALTRQIVENLLQLENDRTSTDKVDMEVYEQILRIVRFHVRQPEQLLTVVQQLKEKVSDTTKLRRILRTFVLDICPQANTHTCVQFLMKVVRMVIRDTEHREYLTSEASLGIQHLPIIFSKLSLMRKVQLKSLKTIFDVVKSDQYRRMLLTEQTMPIFSSGWLSLGALVNVYFSRQGGVEPYLLPMEDTDYIRHKYYSTPWEVRKQHLVNSNEFRSSFIEEVQNALKSSSIRRGLAIKVVKNSGLFEFFTSLKSIVNQRDSVSTSDRVQAVYAMQNMLLRQTLTRLTSSDVAGVLNEQKYIRDNAEYIRHFDKESTKIQSSLISWFTNKREDPELRIACYRVLIQSPIKPQVLSILVQSLLSDPSQVVYTYCVQHMTQIVKSPLLRYQHVIPTIRTSLSMLRSRRQFSATFSRVFSGQMWDRLHDMGLSLETDMIVSDKSFTPRLTHFRLERQAFGRSYPLFEIGVRTEGLQTILQKAFGPRGKVNSLSDLYDAIQKLSRSRRSSSSQLDVSELLQIIPRVLEEIPRMEISVSVMGYDVIFVRNTREVRQLIQTGNRRQLDSYLRTLSRTFNTLGSLFSVSNFYELPTPVGTIIDFNFIGNIKVQLKNMAIKFETTSEDEGVAKTLLEVQPLITMQAFKRVGSNMHLLNHFHQWKTDMKIGLPQKTQIRFTLGKVNERSDIDIPTKMTFAVTIPQRKTKMFEFSNVGHTVVYETRFDGGRLQQLRTANEIQHRSIDQLTTFTTQPLVNRVLKHFGVQLDLSGQYISNEQLFNGPCTMITGPSKFSVHILPIVDVTEPIILLGQLEYSQNSENWVVKDLMAQLSLLKTKEETPLKSLLKFTYKTKEIRMRKLKFETTLSWNVNLPTDSEVFTLRTDGQLEMPEDLEMDRVEREGQWLKNYRWVKDRQLKLKLDVRGTSGEDVATFTVTKKSNEALKNLLQRLSLKKLLQTYPLLQKCKDEVMKSVENTNPIFTPSCSEQYKQFNKLSQVQVEMTRKVDWFMNRRTSVVLNQVLQTLGRYMQPYLVDQTILATPENQKVVIKSQPSPLDLRVHNVEVTCRNWRMTWKSIQLPATPFYWTGVDPVVTAVTDYVKGGTVKCSLRNSHVRTFDNVVYSIPKTTYSDLASNQCPVLLAADCSEQKAFQLTTQIKDGYKIVQLTMTTGSIPMRVQIKKSITSDEKDAKIFMNDNEIDQTIDSDGNVENMFWNRRILHGDKFVNYVFSKFTYAKTSMYRITSREHQINLLVGGPKLRTVELRVSPFYHNKICGLCGDYNSEQTQEFKGPKMHVQTTAKSMVQQYVLPISDKCTEMSRSSSRSVIDYQTSDSFSSIPLPSYEGSSLYDEPRQRLSCQISVSDKYVKTFNSREMSLTSPAIQKLLDRIGCGVKLAVADLDGSRVSVTFNHVKNVIVLHYEDQKVELPISYQSLESTSISEGSLSGLKIQLQKISKHLSPYYRVTVSKASNKFLVDIIGDRRIIVRDGNFVSGHGVCQLTHKSQLSYSSSNQMGKLVDYLTHGSHCNQQLKSHLLQCDIKSNKLQPFHRSGDLTRQEIDYLTPQLMDLMATKPKSVLILSVDSSSSDSSIYSTQMSFSKQDGQIIRHLRVRKGLSTIVELRIPQDDSSSTRIFYGDKQLSPEQCQQLKDLGHGFQCTYYPSEKKLSIIKSNALYSISIKLVSEPVIKVQRLTPHPEYRQVGICGSIEPIWSDYTHSNAHAVLIKGLEQTVSLRSGSGAIVTEQEQRSTRDLIRDIDRVEYLPTLSDY